MTTYAAFLLPKQGGNLTRYAEKYSALRVKALTQNPTAFSSTIDSERKMTEEEKLARLQRPNQVIVVAVAQTDPGVKDWVDEEWVGQVTLNGPLTKGQYDAPFTLFGSATGPTSYTFENDPDKGSKDTRQPKTYWHMTALYVDSTHRRKGLANLICTKSFQVAVEGEREDRQAADMRIIIHPDNTIVIDMYKNLGFKLAKETSTLAEAIVASGELANLPKTYNEDKKYTTRGGIIMIRHIN